MTNQPFQSISQTVTDGAMGSQKMVSYFLLLQVFLLGMSCASIYFIRTDILDVKKEVRILGLHFEDQNALMIREGIKKPGDATMGPTNPANPNTTGNEK